MEYDSQQASRFSILRFRLDRTLRTGVPVTQRICNLRCLWCHHDYMDHSLGTRKAISNQTFVEGVKRVIGAAGAQTATVRISGDGEPTLVGEDELLDLIQRLREIPQVKEIKLTTNGILLGPIASSLKQAGLDNVTISLNSLDPDVFFFYAGVDSLGTVLDSIEYCLSAGLNTKINTIFSRLNAREINDFVQYAQEHSQVILKFFDLIPWDQLTNRLYLPLCQLESQVEFAAVRVTELTGAYIGKQYLLTKGGQIQVKTSSANNCPNLGCAARVICVEGCRSSVRIRADGILQPCGVRSDNIVDLLAQNVSQQIILEALRSGGKLPNSSMKRKSD